MLNKRKLYLSTLSLFRQEQQLLLQHSHPPLSSNLNALFRNPRVSSKFPSLFFHQSRVSWGHLFASRSDGGGGASNCWNCGAASFLYCESCRSVQPVDASVDYFHIFDLEKVYQIKDENLEGKYKDWQKKLHPDLVHTKSEKEKTFAAGQSARVIDAYRTLNKPLSRALYLLQLEGVRIDDEQTITEPDLLAEMMDIREAVDDASDSQALKQIQSQIQLKLDASSNSFKDAFEKQNFDEAIASTQRMRYYERALEEIVKKL